MLHNEESWKLEELFEMDEQLNNSEDFRLSKQDQDLITALKSYTANLKGIPVELVKELDRVSKEINSFKKPLFVDSKGEPISYDHWEEFAFTGLCPDEFVLTDFYLTGFGDSEE